MEFKRRLDSPRIIKPRPCTHSHNNVCTNPDWTKFGPGKAFFVENYFELQTKSRKIYWKKVFGFGGGWRRWGWCMSRILKLGQGPPYALNSCLDVHVRPPMRGSLIFMCACIRIPPSSGQERDRQKARAGDEETWHGKLMPTIAIRA